MREIIELQKKIGVKADGVFGKASTIAFAKHFGFTSFEAAIFLGTCDVETQGWKRFEENLNYSWERILQVFPKYVKTESDARTLQFNPIKLGERVYGGRMGNGPEGSGDGHKYRGRSAVHLTGKDNYMMAGRDLGIVLHINPDIAKTTYAFDIAFWFFTRNKIWSFCKNADPATILTVSRAVNLGSPNSKGTPNHLKERGEAIGKYLNWLNNV